MSEKKLFKGEVDLSSLKIGDSLLNPEMSQWNFVSNMPQIVAESWMCLHEGSHISNMSKVGESPMKDWEKDLGIIVTTVLDIFQGGERLVMLRKSRVNGFGLYRSVNTRPIK